MWLGIVRGSLKYRKKETSIRCACFIFPFVYTLFDAVSMVFEGVILNDDGGETMGEIDFLILEGLMFLIMGAGAWVYLLLRKKTLYNPFGKGEMVRNKLGKLPHQVSMKHLSL